MNREETTRSGPWTVDTNTSPKIPTYGAPMIAIEVTAATANPIIKVQADFGSGTVRSIRCAHLDGASTETLIPADTNTAALAAQDVLLIPSIGAEFVQLTYVSGTSATVKATAFATAALDSWALMKLVASGISLDEFPAPVAITDDFANPTTTNIMAMSMLWDGATWDRSKGDSTDGTLVNLGANNDVTVPTDPFGFDADVASTTGSISAKLKQIATDINAIISGSEVQADIVGALPAGTNAIGKLAANSGVDIGDVDVTSISAGTNLIGDTGLAARASGSGLLFYKTIDLDESEEQVKATAGQIYGFLFHNKNASDLYLKFYNATAATVVVGTTVPDLTYTLKSGQTTGYMQPVGLVFGTAITIAATTAVADGDSGAPAANDVVGSVFYA